MYLPYSFDFQKRLTHPLGVDAPQLGLLDKPTEMRCV